MDAQDKDAENAHSPEHLPADLIAALRAELPPLPDITAKADREVARLAAQAFADRAPTRFASRTALIGIAASLLLATTIVLTVINRPQPEALLFTDVDASGRIDIADVLALAQRSPRISQADLDAFAASIVSLQGNGDAT